MLSVVVVSATCSAVVASAITFWLLSRKRTLRVEELEIVDQDDVRGKLSTFDGKVGLALADDTGRIRVGVFVNNEGQPEITLFDDKGNGRVSLEVVVAPEDLRLSKQQRKEMSAEEMGRFVRKHLPHRPMMVFVDENGDKRTVLTTDHIALWGKDRATIAALSSVPPRPNAPAGGSLTLANQGKSGSVRLGVMPLGRPFVECREEGKRTYSWPPDSTQ